MSRRFSVAVICTEKRWRIFCEDAEVPNCKDQMLFRYPGIEFLHFKSLEPAERRNFDDLIEAAD